jgi:ABC-type antimicrobial peptide transport system permease subunit
MKEGFLLVLFGLAAGIVLALVVARVISSMIFGVSPADPVALGTSVIVMAAIALAASAVPAVRATRTDPATVLRAE